MAAIKWADKIWDKVKGRRVLQSRGEFTQLLNLMKKLEVRSVLEIGVYEGGTALAFMEAGCKVVGIDHEPQEKALELAKDPRFTLIEADSSNAYLGDHLAAVFSSFDMVHIDGGHTYEQVRKDFYNYVFLASKLVAFHDIKETETTLKWGENMGVPKFWKELKEVHPHTYEFLTNEHETGGIGVITLGNVQSK